ncbi:MAG: DUF4157 domain-containing protein [Sedimenticolaceae bacterium]
MERQHSILNKVPSNTRSARVVRPRPVTALPVTGGVATAYGAPCQGSGTALQPGFRRGLEARLGTSLGSVRIHTDSTAAAAAGALRARAFTLGNDIHFAPRQFDTQSPEGRMRLVHEVVHSVQQRGGEQRGDRSDGAAQAAAEREAWRGGNSLLAGQGFRVEQRVARQVQCDDSDAPPVRPFSASPEFQLQLSPEVEAMILRAHLRRWMAGLWLTGSPPADTSVQGEPEAGAGVEGATPSVPSADAAAAAAVAAQAGPVAQDSTSQPPFLRPPLPSADSLSPVPDVGKLLVPFNARQVPAGARDMNEVMAIYRRNYSFVSFLPDLRSAVPGFVRPLIPTDWRRGLAETLTSATVDTQLKHDFPSFVELSDQFVFRTTGIKTSYLPSLSLLSF